MIGTYDSKDEYRKISYALLFFAGCTFLVLTYVYYFPFFENNGYSNQYLKQGVYVLAKTIPNAIAIKIAILLLSASAIMTYTSKVPISEEKKKYMGEIGFTALFLFCLLMAIEYFTVVPGILGITVHTITYTLYLFCLLAWRRQKIRELKNDRRQITESQFDQYRELVDTPNSVNILYEYSYLGDVRTSWMNIVQPYRGSLVGGIPGSGKSFAIIETYMMQMIKKGFTGVIYDFKFPTLSKKTYNYFLWYQHLYKVKPSFYVMNFDDPEYSHRCNPINLDSLETITDAEENTKVLMLNINKTWLEKEGDFFTDSANVFSAMLLWYLKLVSKKYNYNVCSFPHLVKLAAFPSTELLFFILLRYDELKAKMKSFQEAMDKDASDQLAGQVASATTALAKVSNKELDYLMSGDDFSFDLNDPLAPKILTIGNNPDRQIVYSPSIGLILTKLAKTMNKQHREPSMFNIDEFPTVYVRGIDNLIATGRSNKIAVVLGFQTFAQIKGDYGEDTCEKIVRGCGNRIAGQLFDEDAEKLSKTIGKQKNLSVSYNYSSEDVTENQQVNMEDIVPPERIAQFSQGTVCAVIADEFKNKELNKICFGDVVPAMDLKAHEEDLEIPKIREFLSDKEKKEKRIIFEKENEELINKFFKILEDKSIEEWINIMERVTTVQKLNNYLADEYKMTDEELEKWEGLIDLIQFKMQMKKWIEKEIHRREKADEINFLNSKIERSKFQEIFDKWLEDGFGVQAKDKFLEEYSRGLQEDILRIVAMEMEDLGIIKRFTENNDSYYNKHKRTAIRIFKNIIEEFAFSDEYTKNLYESMIKTLEEAN